ncbi:MAG: 16S rRNA (cytosine(1402)-N(4))-methyltransferase, partial [Terrimicrobiaceae bacterium]|nr:16S rRNA (cytosine(1402)-N(4))-methyltransferase [Terrimicrobiaceae bacterium]
MLINILDCEDPPACGLPRPESSGHRPVMPVEVEAFLRPRPGLVILDGTAGGGGHAELMLEAGAEVVALDQDEEAVAACTRRLAGFGQRCRVVQANFAAADQVLDALGIAAVDGALLDVGVSSMQLESAERGFSFLREGPLDMRMNRSGSMTAEVLVNTAD